MRTYSLGVAMWGSQADFGSVVRGVASAGFQQCELWAPACTFDGAANVAAMRRALNQHGVWARTIHPPIGSADLAAPDEGARQSSVAEIGACFEPFAELGGFAAIVHPSGKERAWTEGARRAAVDAFRRSLDALYQKADGLGMRLACENLQLKGQPRPLCRMEELRALLDQYPPDVGICLDTGHAHNSGLNSADEARIAGDRLIALHLQDTDAVEDRHWVPGRGTVNWAQVHAALTEIGFSGAWTFELAAHDSDPDSVAVEARRVADAWSLGRF